MTYFLEWNNHGQIVYDLSRKANVFDSHHHIIVNLDEMAHLQTVLVLSKGTKVSIDQVVSGTSS